MNYTTLFTSYRQPVPAATPPFNTWLDRVEGLYTMQTGNVLDDEQQAYLDHYFESHVRAHDGAAPLITHALKALLNRP